MNIQEGLDNEEVNDIHDFLPRTNTAEQKRQSISDNSGLSVPSWQHLPAPHWGLVTAALSADRASGV